jgi:hypothetical protein
MASHAYGVTALYVAEASPSRSAASRSVRMTIADAGLIRGSIQAGGGRRSGTRGPGERTLAAFHEAARGRGVFVSA